MDFSLKLFGMENNVAFVNLKSENIKQIRVWFECIVKDSSQLKTILESISADDVKVGAKVFAPSLLHELIVTWRRISALLSDNLLEFTPTTNRIEIIKCLDWISSRVTRLEKTSQSPNADFESKIIQLLTEYRVSFPIKILNLLTHIKITVQSLMKAYKQQLASSPTRTESKNNLSSLLCDDNSCENYSDEKNDNIESPSISDTSLSSPSSPISLSVGQKLLARNVSVKNTALMYDRKLLQQSPSIKKFVRNSPITTKSNSEEIEKNTDEKTTFATKREFIKEELQEEPKHEILSIFGEKVENQEPSEKEADINMEEPIFENAVQSVERDKSNMKCLDVPYEETREQINSEGHDGSLATEKYSNAIVSETSPGLRVHKITTAVKVSPSVTDIKSSNSLTEETIPNQVSTVTANNIEALPAPMKPKVSNVHIVKVAIPSTPIHSKLEMIDSNFRSVQENLNTTMVNLNLSDLQLKFQAALDFLKNYIIFMSQEIPNLPPLICIFPLNDMINKHVAVVNEPYLIGRSHLEVKVKTQVVSRNHLSINFLDGKFFVQDTGSNSGSFINGRRLSEAGASSQLHEIVSGDIIQLGVDYNQSRTNPESLDSKYKCIRFIVALKPSQASSALPLKLADKIIANPEADKITAKRSDRIESNSTAVKNSASFQNITVMTKSSEPKNYRASFVEQNHYRVNSSLSLDKQCKRIEENRKSFLIDKEKYNIILESGNFLKKKEIRMAKIYQGEDLIMVVDIKYSGTGRKSINMQLKKMNQPKGKDSLEVVRDSENMLKYHIISPQKTELATTEISNDLRVLLTPTFCSTQFLTMLSNDDECHHDTSSRRTIDSSENEVSTNSHKSSATRAFTQIGLTAPVFSLTGDFGSGRFLYVMKQNDTRQQRLIGECTEKKIIKSSALHNEWNVCLEIENLGYSDLLLVSTLIGQIYCGENQKALLTSTNDANLLNVAAASVGSPKELQ